MRDTRGRPCKLRLAAFSVHGFSAKLPQTPPLFTSPKWPLPTQRRSSLQTSKSPPSKKSVARGDAFLCLEAAHALACLGAARFFSKGRWPKLLPVVGFLFPSQLAKFIQHATKRKWLHTKEQRKVVSVVDVNRSHPDYKSYCPVPEAQKAARLEKAKTDAAAASGGQTASEKNASSATECAEEEAPAASPKQTKNAAGKTGRPRTLLSAAC